MIIKICGIKSIETLRCCENNNINFFGMIFYNKSPRNITFDDALLLQNEAKTLSIKGVGVFVNEEINIINEYISDLHLKYIQLHGEEDNSFMNQLKKNQIKIIKKISISEKKDLSNIKNYNLADYFLFDYKPNNYELPGGNAKSFDWRIIQNLKLDKPWFLSGGIKLENIEEIKSKIKPFGIDLSSGVEKELGIKDNGIINNFMEKLKYA
tara:strand:- start:97 stop:726 length:630 start_codon:yes stop_codon:yes gene_type:complete